MVQSEIRGAKDGEGPEAIGQETFRKERKVEKGTMSEARS